MKDYTANNLRNIALVSHGGAGKTSLIDARLFTAGGSDRLGKVDDGNTVSDYDPDEIKRKITINTSIVPCEWSDHKLNLVDTPGYPDFISEVLGALSVTDAALMVVCAVSGIEVNTGRMWNLAEERNLPRLIFINKLDRENAHFDQVLNQIQSELSANAIPVQIPIGSEDDFRGIVDLLAMKALYFENGTVKEGPIPEDLLELAESYHEKMVEAAAETDDDLTMKYLEGEKLSRDEIIQGLRHGTLEGTVFPVLCGSAYTNKGSSLLLDALIDYLPSPVDRPAQTAIDPSSNEDILLECDNGHP